MKHKTTRTLLLPTLALAALMALAGTSAAEASCTGFPGNMTLARGSGYSTSATVANLAFATYYIGVSQSGNFGLLNFDATPLPGFTQGSTKGFVGTGTTLFIGFFVPPTVPSGRQATGSIRVYNVLGQTVCEGVFTVTVA